MFRWQKGNNLHTGQTWLAQVPPWFRRAFPYSRWGAELNARITPRFFGWLVGPMQVEEAVLPDGTTQRSAVKIERCRCGALQAPGF